MKARRQVDVKRANQNLLFDTIRREGGISISNLVFRTQLSRPTVTASVRALEAAGMIYASGCSASEGGRTAALYSIRGDARFAIGVDCEFPGIRISIVNLNYETVARTAFQLDESVPWRAALDRISDEIEHMLARNGIDRTLCLGVGVGLPGQIDRTRNHSIIIEKLPGWQDVPVGRLISERLGMPVYLENDVNLFAWAEYRLNPCGGKGRNRLFLYVRNGLGMGIVMNGRLLEGSMGNAGRIGHMGVNADGPRCVCGNRGCLTMYSSGKTILSRFREISPLPVQALQDVTRLADQGNDGAERILRDAGRYLGNAAVSLTKLFDVSYLVVSAKGNPEYFAGEIEKAFREQTDYYRLRDVEIHTLEDTDDSILPIGGCVWVVDHFLEGMEAESQSGLASGLAAAGEAGSFSAE